MAKVFPLQLPPTLSPTCRGPGGQGLPALRTPIPYSTPTARPRLLGAMPWSRLPATLRTPTARSCLTPLLLTLRPLRPKSCPAARALNPHGRRSACVPRSCCWEPCQGPDPTAVSCSTSSLSCCRAINSLGRRSACFPRSCCGEPCRDRNPTAASRSSYYSSVLSTPRTKVCLLPKVLLLGAMLPSSSWR